MSLMKLQYYDQPEGRDIFGKMVATNRYALTVGFAWSVVDTLMITKPKGYVPTFAVFAKNIGPLVSMATAFTMVTYVSRNVRDKDDKLNYVLGGVAAGCVYGTFRRSPTTTLISSIFFSIAGYVKKLSKEEGWDFFPPPKSIVRKISRDYSWMKDPKEQMK